MNLRIFLTAAAAGLACAPAIHAQTPAKSANPWAGVPALPTACYSGQDTWSEQATAAFDAVQQGRYRQDEINRAINQNAQDTQEADPMAVAQRMQQKMMEDPANAQKYMEQMLQQGQQLQAEIPERLAKEQQIENDSKALVKQYEAALEKAKGPGNARLAALVKKYNVEPGSGDLWLRYGDPGEPAWVRPEAHAILRQWNEAYAATCPQWWGAGGQFHAYMKRYKDFLLLERIPYEKQFDVYKLDHYKTIGVSTAGWRTTTDYQAAEDYIKMAQSLFGSRETTPYCGPDTPCR